MSKRELSADQCWELVIALPLTRSIDLILIYFQQTITIMNHLAGLQVECETLRSLSATDEATLASFRKAHEAAKPNDANDCNADVLQTSRHDVDPGELPPCGWRPLDDVTLWRFLCADERNGKFQPEVSHARLKRALSFRKEAEVDAILGGGDNTCDGEERRADEQDKEGADFAAVPPPLRVDSVASLTSMASGVISDCGEMVKEMVVTVPTLSTTPKSGNASDEKSSCVTRKKTSSIDPRDLERYQRLRVRVFVGRDRLGQPVLFERLGHFLGSGNCDHFTQEEWIRFYIWDLERHFTEMRNASEECGKAITRFTYVADATGIYAGIMNRAVWRVIPLLKALVKAVEEHYPEIADKIVLFNVPRVASVFYRAVRTFLDPVTAEKIEIHSGVPMDILEKIMQNSVIPREYGGSNDVNYPHPVTQ